MNERFQKWVEEVVRRNGGWRKAAEKAGCVHATLLKAAGHLPSRGALDLDTLMALAKLGNVPLAYVIELYTGEPAVETELMAMAQQLRQEHPELAEVFALASAAGEDVLRDVLHYARFRLRHALDNVG